MLLAVPPMLRLLRPGSIYGVCYGAALAKPSIWYEINQGAGWRMFKTGLLTMIASSGFYFIPNLSAAGYYFSCAIVMVGLFVSGLIKTARHLKYHECL